MDEPIEDQACQECGTPSQFGHATSCSQHPRIIEKNQRYADRPETNRTHRFEVSRDPEIREKLHLFREGFEILQARCPEVIGATVFGSSTKGLATHESDVDSSIFLDPDQAAIWNADFKVTTEIAQDKKGIKHMNSEVDEQTDSIYASELARIVNQPPYDGEKSIVEHVMVWPMNREIIDVHLKAYLKSLENVMAYQYDRMMSGENTEEPSQPQQDSKAPRPLWVGASLVELFHLQIGHGLDPLREHLINQLKESKYGEPAWRGIIKCLENSEEWQAYSGYRYPRLLKDAANVYGNPEGTSEHITDGFDQTIDSALTEYLNAMIEDDTFRGKVFLDGMKSYQLQLVQIAERRGGEDQNAWAEYWAARAYIDLAKLYPDFTVISDGIEPSVLDLDAAINNLPSDELRDKWRQKADEMIEAFIRCFSDKKEA